jgi:RNA polymerase sigma factor (sigma-70 family)
MDNLLLTEIVKVAQTGNQAALEMLYQERAASVYYISLKLFENEKDAEKITQEVFIYVFQKILELHEPSDFHVWLSRITTSKCTSTFKKRKVSFKKHTEDVFRKEQIEESDSIFTSEKLLNNAEIINMIIDLINNLPVSQRICVYYYYYEQLTVAQISENISVDENTVSNRLAIVRGKIRKVLKPLDEEDLTLLNAVPLMLSFIIKKPLQGFKISDEILVDIKNKIAESAAAAIELKEAAVQRAASATQIAPTNKKPIAKKTVEFPNFKNILCLMQKQKLVFAIMGVAVFCGVAIGVVFAQPWNNSLPAIGITQEEFDRAVAENESLREAFNKIEAGQNPPPLPITTTTMMPITTTTMMPITTTTTPIAVFTPPAPPAIIPPFITIQGVQYSTDLTELNFMFSGPQNLTDSDIESLKYMVNLEKFHVQGANITDLSVFGGLINLRSLYIHTNGTSTVTNILPLGVLVNLEELTLLNVLVNDVSPLSRLINLKSLELFGNTLIDIFYLSELPNLTNLSLTASQFVNVSMISKMNNLNALHLWGGMTTINASYFNGLTNLTELGLSSFNITDVSQLSSLTNLKSLGLNNNLIIDIYPLRSLTNLTSLGLNNNQIIDIYPLRYLTNLTFLELGDNQINDIYPLSDMSNLTWLSLWNNPISDEQKTMIRNAIPNCEINFG